MANETPPDPEEMNNERAKAAERALLHFAQNFGEVDQEGQLAEFAEQNLSDLLADLGHYCDRSGLSITKCIFAGSV